MKPIEYYSDYREYLRDFFRDRKERIKSYSYRVFCRKAGIASPSRFKEVVSGERNLTERTIPLFIKGMGLSDQEGSFFTALVHFNQSRSDEEREKYLEEMLVYRRNKVKSLIPLSSYEYFSRWYHPVLRELACLLDWKDDYRLLAKSVQPQIKVSEAKQGIATLLKLGFLKKDRHGRYTQAEPVITTGPEVDSFSVRSLNKEMSILGTRAIERFHREERDISSLTVGASHETYKSIKEEIQSFKERIISLVSDDQESNRVYSLNIQLFPLSCRSGDVK
ncbi:MAG: TIGR02147 family protein [Chitinivibrionales bacterium]